MDLIMVNGKRKLRAYDGRYVGRRTGLRYHHGSTMVVYALCDPRDGRVRYIGITNNLLSRFNEHLRLNGPNERKQAWLREVLDNYMLPIMHTLEVVDVDVDARVREVAWIEAYQKSGANLLNHVETASNEVTEKEHLSKQDLSKKPRLELKNVGRTWFQFQGQKHNVKDAPPSIFDAFMHQIYEEITDLDRQVWDIYARWGIINDAIGHGDMHLVNKDDDTLLLEVAE